MWGLLAGRVSRAVCIAVAGGLLLALAACGQDSRFVTPGSSDESGQPDNGVSLALASPVDKATGVLTSTELAFNAEGKLRGVELKTANGKKVAGDFVRGDNTWVPATQLAYGTTYHVKAHAKTGKKSATVESSFTTMSAPRRLIGADTYPQDGETVGIGMPVVVEFTEALPEDLRADVERRLFVTTNPATEGTWHWVNNGQVDWRPKQYWKPGTKVSVRIGIGGMDLGNGKYGKRDRMVDFTIGSAVISTVDNATKKMTVTKDGEVVREFPVSLGKPSMPTSSGTHVIIERRPEAIFDSSTFGVPVDSPDGYREKIFWTVRFTWGGEFVHSAPWSVGDQGVRNVSHGCVNAAPDNAQWFYEHAKKGDLLIVKGTETQVKANDGWTDWNVDWEEYRKGSALYKAPPAKPHVKPSSSARR